jgi:uncharacterized membrane protein YdcZ (DUF606 family)
MFTTIVPALLALICGAVLTTQVGSNTSLGKSLNNPYIPAAANMVTGLVFTVLLLLIVHKSLRQEAGTTVCAAASRQAPQRMLD